MPDAVEPVSNQFYWGWRSRVMLALYAGRVDADAEWIDAGYRRIVASLLWQVPAVRLDVSIGQAHGRSRGLPRHGGAAAPSATTSPWRASA